MSPKCSSCLYVVLKLKGSTNLINSFTQCGTWSHLYLFNTWLRCVLKYNVCCWLDQPNMNEVITHVSLQPRPLTLEIYWIVPLKISLHHSYFCLVSYLSVTSLCLTFTHTLYHFLFRSLHSNIPIIHWEQQICPVIPVSSHVSTPNFYLRWHSLAVSLIDGLTGNGVASSLHRCRL